MSIANEMWQLRPSYDHDDHLPQVVRSAASPKYLAEPRVEEPGSKR